MSRFAVWISKCPRNVRIQRESRLNVLTLSFVEIDPSRNPIVHRSSRDQVDAANAMINDDD
jgi:hypothetical protein